jgi:excisionase family DNA binding protein
MKQVELLPEERPVYVPDSSVVDLNIVDSFKSQVRAKKTRDKTRITAAQLNEIYVVFEADKKQGKGNLAVALSSFVRNTERVSECKKLLNEVPETFKDIDDVFSDFYLELVRRMEKEYTHVGKLDKWIDYIWTNYFLPSVQKNIYEYLNQTTFVNEDDPEDPEYEVQHNCVARYSVESERLDRETEGYFCPISKERRVRELDDPSSMLNRMSDTAKKMCRMMASGCDKEEIARELKLSKRQVNRILETAVKDLAKVRESCAPEDDGRDGFDISASADEDFEPLLNASEAAQLFRCHEKTVQALARAGKIPCLRFGKYWRFRKSSLDAWVDAQIESDQSRRVS